MVNVSRVNRGDDRKPTSSSEALEQSQGGGQAVIYCMAGIVLLTVYSAVLTFYIILIIEKHNILCGAVRDMNDKLSRLERSDVWNRLENPLSDHYTLGTDLVANKEAKP